MAIAPASPSLKTTLPGRFTGMARTGQVASSFVAVLVAYWLYGLIVVPMIEPNVEQEPIVQARDEDIQQAREQNNSRAKALTKYFAPGSWELNQPGIWEREQTQLLFKDPEVLRDGTVKFSHCTLLMFSKERGADGEPTAPPMIMQAPQGARVQFDEPIELKSVDFSKRELMGGSLIGPITIHREPSRPGADDGLLIEARDIEMIKERAFTPHPVKFQMGRNHGSGRDMEILLAPHDGAQKGLRGGSFKSLELKRDVIMYLDLGGAQLAPGPPARAKPRGPEPPSRITCQGSFRYDVARNAASFHDKVDFVRPNPAGPSDTLNCELLTVVFASQVASPTTARPASQPPVTSPADNSQSSNLQIQVIEARGDPVVVRSPAQGMYVHCKGIDYSPAPGGATGRLLAIGPGTMQGHATDDPASIYQVHWTHEFRFDPDGPQQVAAVRGGATIQYALIGEISADEIFAWLSPTNPQVTGNQWQLERVLAQDAEKTKRSGQPPSVVIKASQLDGNTRKLEVWIERPKVAENSQPTANPDPTQPPPEHKPLGGPQNSAKKFDVRGGSIRIKLLPEGTQFAVSTVTIEHQARLEDKSPRRPDEKPLLVEGDRLHVADANTEATRVTVNGKPGYLEAGGMTLRGSTIEMEQRTNRLWIDGPGQMTMPMNQDLQGQPIAKPETMRITWDGGMDFRTNTVLFNRNVLAKSNHQFLRTEKLAATLTRPVDFGNLNQSPPAKPDEQPQLAQLRCHGPAYLEGRQFDERGRQTSLARADTPDLAIDRITGAISATGPGWITYVSYGSDQAMRKRPGQVEQPKPPSKSADELKYLHVQYQNSITGNLNRREVTFGDKTKTVYGPVPNWEAKLDAEDPASAGPQGIVLDARQLTVRQTAPRNQAERGWFELSAVGNVLAESVQFTARGHELDYAEEKDQIILRGDARSPAEFFQEDPAGGPRRDLKAGEVSYWITLNKFNVNRYQSGNLDVPQSPSKTPAAKK